MSIGQMVIAVHHEYHPPLLFFVGLFVSVLVCLFLTVIESRFRQRQFDAGNSTTRNRTYQRFHNELISTDRHVGFTADEIHELNDDEFHLQ